MPSFRALPLPLSLLACFYEIVLLAGGGKNFPDDGQYIVLFAFSLFYVYWQVSKSGAPATGSTALIGMTLYNLVLCLALPVSLALGGLIFWRRRRAH